MTIKVMVVDDSAFMRKVISDQINSISNVTVCAVARSGEDALLKLKRETPNLITLDIEMSGIGGLETLKIIKKEYKIPVIMLSSHSGKEMTITCLEYGAMDFVEKPLNISQIEASFMRELETKIKSIVTIPSSKEISETKRQNYEKKFPTKVRGIVIGSSTGGPKALMELIKYIPKELSVPIFIVQHMPSGFTKSFSNRMNSEAAVEVVEAKHMDLIKPGVVYIAPGDYHMRIDQKRIYLTNEEEKINSVRPAVDPLFETASKVYGKSLVGIILTGMGSDGAEGMKIISENKGYTIAQDRETSVVYGMPRRAVELGVVDEILSLDMIGTKLNWMIRVK
ncbi:MULTISPECIES: chemotaxis response regulator protein-glutamate methylesterase [Vagococcus]|uniref:Protein-glutamate methylesterase/protein-glutamine glutaminase n=1 Tax=Vagococcus fluvialis bH819 TaxID=1255619 RepID=A0A1X6WRN5_9ENTE|nr:MULTISPECIES: chemotaxis response regulator protein-glutamate methylesterase [Vagococcus]SLM86902.1 Chemotaxis response regulator protein-glutamate methylesterase CheB [Vagococcus fluvialis bH819]